MPFVDILTFRHPDGGSNVQQSHCSIRPYLHLRHTSQPGQVLFPELEEVVCPKHPSDLNQSPPEEEIQKMGKRPTKGEIQTMEGRPTKGERSMMEEEQERMVEETLKMEGESTKGEEPAL